MLPSEVTVYTVEAQERQDTPSWAQNFSTYDHDEARKYARENKFVVIANTYTWDDSEPLENYSPQDWAITYGGNSKDVDDEPEIVERYRSEEEARDDLASLYAGDAEYRVRHWPETAQYPDEG